MNNPFQIVVQDYTSSVRGNNSLLYTHVEENSGRAIMEGLVFTNAASWKVLVAIMGKQALLLLKKNEESYKYFWCKCSLVWETRNKKEEKDRHIIFVSQSVPILRNKVSAIIGNEAW